MDNETTEEMDSETAEEYERLLQENARLKQEIARLEREEARLDQESARQDQEIARLDQEIARAEQEAAYYQFRVTQLRNIMLLEGASDTDKLVLAEIFDSMTEGDFTIGEYRDISFTEVAKDIGVTLTNVSQSLQFWVANGVLLSTEYRNPQTGATHAEIKLEAICKNFDGLVLPRPRHSKSKSGKQALRLLTMNEVPE